MADDIPEVNTNKKPLYTSSFDSPTTSAKVNSQVIVGEAKDITSEIQAAHPLNENEDPTDIRDKAKERPDSSADHEEDPSKKDDYVDKSSI